MLVASPHPVEVTEERTEILEEVVDYLHTGVNVNVVGLRSSGRSAVLQRVTELLAAEGTAVIRIAGVRALRDRSLSALAVAGIDVSASPNHPATLTSAGQALEALLAAGPSVLAIDDADDLDPATVGTVIGVHGRLRMPVITTSRPAGRRQADVGALTSALQPGVRVTMRPLPFDAVHRLVQHRLDGPVEPAVIARIAAASGGLPGLISAMVDADRRDHLLAVRGGVWVARGDLWTTPLAHCVEPLLADLDDAALDAITLLSFAGTVSVRAAQRIVGAEQLARLDDAGLLHVLPVGGDFLVDVFPPLIAEYVTHEAPTTRYLWARERLDAAQEAVARPVAPVGGAWTGPRVGAGPVAPAAVAAGGAPAVGMGLVAPVVGSAPAVNHRGGSGALVPTADRAAAASRRLAQYWQEAARSRQAAWEFDPVPAAAEPLLEALLVTRVRPHEIEHILAGTRTPGDDVPALSRFVTLGTLYTGCAAGDAAGARALAARHLADLGPYTDGVRAAEELVGLVNESIAPAVVVDHAGDNPTGNSAGPDLAELQDRLHRGPDPQGTAFRILVRAEGLLATGQVGAATAALDSLGSLEAQPDSLGQYARVTRQLALLYSCDIDGAVAAATKAVEAARESLDPSMIEAHAYVASLGLALAGRVAELDALTASVLALSTTPVQHDHYQSGLLALAASAAHWRANYGYARSLTLQAEALGQGPGPHPYMAPTAVADLMRDGSDAAGADRLWNIAAERLERGFLPAGIITGVAAIERAPDAGRAAELAAAARRCDSPLLTYLGAYAVAIASPDPRELVDLEPDLRRVGLRLYAVRAAVSQAIGLRDSGDIAAAADQADDAWHRAGLRGRDLCGLFRRFDRAINLTAREREVAVHVARGLHSPQIAETMVLSVRTVENHIFNACRKVGVDSREGLARAAQTWLSCAIE